MRKQKEKKNKNKKKEIKREKFFISIKEKQNI